MNFTIHHGDCLEIMRGMADNSVDSIVTDPPYGLSFMGKKWDYDVPGVDVWAECLRVLKPGGHLLAFAGTRTQHRMAVRIEDAGFEIRDMIAWVYGSGFPKSHNGEWGGTALKPALEPITMARKPLSITESHLCDCKNRYRRPVLIGGIETCPDCYGSGVKRITRAATVDENSAAWGTGGLNIDGCRVGWPDGKAPEIGTPGWGGPSKKSTAVPGQDGKTVERMPPSPLGRWPANLIHDGSDEVVASFPDAKGQQGRARTDGEAQGNNTYGALNHVTKRPDPRGDTGSAARFFYCAKASRKDRNEGLEDPGPQFKRGTTLRQVENTDTTGNTHPTVKPTELMRYLVRLVTPPGGVVLDPFMGSGSTGKAAVHEGFQFIGIEREAGYVEIARARIDAANPAAPEKPSGDASPQETLPLFEHGAA